MATTLLLVFIIFEIKIIFVAAVFLALNDLQDHIQDLRTRLDFLVGLRVTEPTKDFVKGKNLHGVANFQGDLKETRLQKKAYDKSRVSYESAQENLKNLEKNPKTNPKTLKEVSIYFFYVL